LTSGAALIAGHGGFFMRRIVRGLVKTTRNRSTPSRSKPDRPPHARGEPHPYRLYRVTRLAALFDVDYSTIWRWKKSGVLPPPAVQFPGFEAWTEEQIKQVIEQRRQEAADA
jgi:predicted DNA-binding transcriptional regulator AlpA